MNQVQATSSGPLVPVEYGSYGGFEVNELMGSVMAPVEVPQVMGNEVQVYYPQPQAENSYYLNKSYSEPQSEEMMKLKAQAEFWKNESLFWQFEGNCYTKEKESWKNEAGMWKSDAEKWKGEASNWQGESLKWKAEASKWQAESVKWKEQAEKCHAEYCKALKQRDAIWHIWRECENAKATNLQNFQTSFQKLSLEGEEKDKTIEKQKKDLLEEIQSRAIVQAELKAQIEAVEQVKNHEKMLVANLQKDALAKENELQSKLDNRLVEFEKFAEGANGKISELEEQVCSLQSDLNQKDSVLSGFNHYCGQLYEEKRLVNVELREVKDFMVALTCDLQDNLGKFMRRYNLSVTPELESKWDWRTPEEKCLVSHLRMLVNLTENTFQEWEENGMLKGKQDSGADKSTGNAVGTGDFMETKRPEKRELSGCSYNAPVATRSGSSKKWKF